MLPDDPRVPVLPYQPRAARRQILDQATRVLQTRPFWALADQGIASGSNFITIILLTRHLSATAFGEFSLLWELLMFLNGLHAAMIVYPLSVRGARIGGEPMRQMSTIALILTLALAGPIGGAMLRLGAWRALSIGVWAALAIAAFQVHETLRRVLMSQFRYTELIRGDAVGYLGQLAGVFALAWTDRLSIEGVFATMTFSFLCASAVQAMCLRPRPAGRPEVRAVGSEFWVLGRWMLASNLMAFFTGIGVQFCLAWGHDLTHVAKFQAIQNLVRFANPVLAVMTGLIIPAVARSGQAQSAGRYILLGGALLLPYFGMLMVAPGFGVSLLYSSDSEYVGYPMEVRVTVASAAVLFASAMLAAILGGLGHSKTFFLTQVVNTVANILLVIPAAIFWGWRAATVAVLGTTFITLVTTLLLVLRNPRPHGHPITINLPPSP